MRIIDGTTEVTRDDTTRIVVLTTRCAHGHTRRLRLTFGSDEQAQKYLSQIKGKPCNACRV